MTRYNSDGDKILSSSDSQEDNIDRIASKVNQTEKEVLATMNALICNQKKIIDALITIIRGSAEAYWMLCNADIAGLETYNLLRTASATELETTLSPEYTFTVFDEMLDETADW